MLKTDQAARHESEARQAFLLKLSDALRPLADANAIQFEASRVLREQLGASRVIYTEATGPDELGVVATDSLADVPNQLGQRCHTSDTGQAMQAGQTTWREDVLADTGLSDADKAAYAAQQAIAWASVPLVKNGRLVATLTAHFSAPHAWSAGELALVEETAERTWAAAARARAEAALRESESNYRTLCETMDEGFALCEVVRDPHGQAVDVCWLQLNDALERHTGMQRAQVEGRRAREVLPDRAQWWIDVTAQVVDTGEAVHVEQEETDLGRWFEVHVYPRGGQRVGVLYQDVTAHRQAETALREREETFRALVEPFAQSVWETDAAGLVAIDSPAWRAVTGQTLEGWPQAVHPDDRAEAARQWQVAVRDGTPRVSSSACTAQMVPGAGSTRAWPHSATLTAAYASGSA